MKIAYALAILCLAFARTAAAQTVTCERISGVNAAMTSSIVERLNALGDLSAIEKRGARVLVRIIPSTSAFGGAKAYAQALLEACPEFRSPDGNLAADAILLIVSNDGVTAFFAGPKVAKSIDRATATRIREEDMDPLAARGDPIGAVINALQSVNQRLQAYEKAPAPTPTLGTIGGASSSQMAVQSQPAALEQDVTELRKNVRWLAIAAAILAAILFIGAPLAFALQHKLIADLRAELDRRITALNEYIERSRAGSQSELEERISKIHRTLRDELLSESHGRLEVLDKFVADIREDWQLVLGRSLQTRDIPRDFSDQFAGDDVLPDDQDPHERITTPPPPKYTNPPSDMAARMNSPI